MKLDKERKVVDLMIDLYCKKNHKSKYLCKECSELKEYVHLRLSKCPFKENKSFCSNCKIHCYEPIKREMIKKVMRFSGPRMIFHHPILAIKHVIESKKERKKLYGKK